MSHLVRIVMLSGILSFLVASCASTGGDQTATSDDGAGTAALLEAFTEAGIDIGEINFSLIDGIATISGTVDDASMTQRIIETAESVDGVVEVRETLTNKN